MFIPELFSRLGVLHSNDEFLRDLLSYVESHKDNDEITLKENFIIFKNVSFAFERHVILDSFDMTIPANKIVGLFGSSGSGKSTFIKLIFGSVVPMEGEIYIGNIPVIKKNCKSLRKYINYMNQNSHSLFDKTIFENVIYGYPDVTKAQVMELLDKYNLYEIFKNLDTGGERYSFLDKPAGKLGENLSGGQKAIIHLIRIDFNQMSRIIILDEVTASLDNVSRNSILSYIKYLNKKNKTIFIISHDTYLESICDLRLQFSHDINPLLR
jgi:ABC-type multidrug transport system fused ATPase/permease subunit